jgi:hypothetical protein
MGRLLLKVIDLSYLPLWPGRGLGARRRTREIMSRVTSAVQRSVQQPLGTVPGDPRQREGSNREWRYGPRCPFRGGRIASDPRSNHQGALSETTVYETPNPISLLSLLQA